MENITDALSAGAIDLIGTATAFGQGALASQLSGNPFYSQDPAAAAYATATGQTANASVAGPSMAMLILLGGFLFVILKK